MTEDLTFKVAFNAAANFILDELDPDSGFTFLGMWREGDWKCIAKEFPEFDLTTTGQCDAQGNLL